MFCTYQPRIFCLNWGGVVLNQISKTPSHHPTHPPPGKWNMMKLYAKYIRCTEIKCTKSVTSENYDGLDVVGLAIGISSFTSGINSLLLYLLIFVYGDHVTAAIGWDLLGEGVLGEDFLCCRKQRLGFWDGGEGREDEIAWKVSLTGGLLASVLISDIVRKHGESRRRRFDNWSTSSIPD